MKDLKALMGKEDEGKASMKKDAKLNVLKSLRKMASDMMGEGVKSGMEGMKKVTVAADDKSSLAEGLEKAKEMVSAEDEEADFDLAEGEDEEMEEGPMSAEEIDAKIAELQALKDKLNV